MMVHLMHELSTQLFSISLNLYDTLSRLGDYRNEYSCDSILQVLNICDDYADSTLDETLYGANVSFSL